VIGIVALTALGIGIFAYESLASGSSGPARTFVTGTLTPQQDVKNFTNVFFISTTTRITYAAPVSGGTYGTYLYSDTVYNVTIELLTTNGNHFCLTLPTMISVTGMRQVQTFDCVNYV
jgi:hypothetical protein